MAKDIHIVFQLLNFLHSPDSDSYQLTANEKLLLITLASRKGKKGIFPSYPLLAKDLKISSRSVIRIMESLIEKGLIVAEKSTGKANHYHLKLSTTRDTGVTGDTDDTRDTGVTPPVTSVSQTRDTGVTLLAHISASINSAAQPQDKKSVDKLHRSEFVPTKSHRQYASAHRKNLEAVLAEYRDRGKIDLGSPLSHEKAFQAFLVASESFEAPRAPLTAEEAWHDTRERLQRGNHHFPTEAQEMLVSHLGWPTIAYASVSGDVKNRFVLLYDSTHLDKRPKQVYSASKTQNPSSRIGFEKSKRHEPKNDVKNDPTLLKNLMRGEND